MTGPGSRRVVPMAGREAFARLFKHRRTGASLGNVFPAPSWRLRPPGSCIPSTTRRMPGTMTFCLVPARGWPASGDMYGLRHPARP